MNKYFSHLRRNQHFIAVLSVVLLSACTNILHDPVPEDFVDTAQVPEFANIRTWADEFSPGAIDEAKIRIGQLRESGLIKKSMNVLTLSGGGENGAFGAGLLNGWTASGTRPEFEIVTGVSTGALIAPLAFLGPDYDQALKDFYTGISTKDILVANPIGGLAGGSALASNDPLKKLIATIITPVTLAKITEQYDRGRRLFVVTTNLEAQRPVLWNLGKIAKQGTPEALELFRSALLASAAIPAAFPPVALKVEANGKFYTELHVDGGTTANAFVAPLNAKLPKDFSSRKEYMYTVMDGKLAPEYKKVDPKTIKIGGRAIGTLLKYKNYADVRRIYLLAERRGAKFKMISVPESFDVKSKEPFDKAYMTKLYQLGYSMGQSGTGWVSNPNVF